jgi:hypothetical protein
MIELRTVSSGGVEAAMEAAAEWIEITEEGQKVQSGQLGQIESKRADRRGPCWAIT